MQQKLFIHIFYLCLTFFSSSLSTRLYQIYWSFQGNILGPTDPILCLSSFNDLGYLNYLFTSTFFAFTLLNSTFSHSQENGCSKYEVLNFGLIILYCLAGFSILQADIFKALACLTVLWDSCLITTAQSGSHYFLFFGYYFFFLFWKLSQKLLDRIKLSSWNFIN